MGHNDTYHGLPEGACETVKNLLLGGLRGWPKVGKEGIRADWEAQVWEIREEEVFKWQVTCKQAQVCLYN